MGRQLLRRTVDLRAGPEGVGALSRLFSFIPYMPSGVAAFDTAERTGLLLTEAFMYRHNPQTRRLRELLEEGVVGDLRVVRACFSFALFDHSNIRLRPELEGGSLMDVGCYCVNGSRLVAGEPELVFGQQFAGPSGTATPLHCTDPPTVTATLPPISLINRKR